MPEFSMEQILDLVTDVGDNIVMKYFNNVESTDKADGSPVTIADKEASAAIIKGLGIITPHIPVISEEQSMEKNLEA
ncbi:MAG: 3'(2'),5'-bisphosphate nucleotidase CysQ, partial [Alphaproteobacteria bacterium]|nr:3'(2'),5'-bisphosphate nucleotidase CysQ [Alphaproteobacteria bacterium]